MQEPILRIKNRNVFCFEHLLKVFGIELFNNKIIKDEIILPCS